MTFEDEVKNGYFEWMVDKLCGRRFAREISFRKLLMRLHDIDFTYTIQRDFNRYEDGIDLRRRFELNSREFPDATRYLNGPCSVLEMMTALTIRCEEDLMDDPMFGDRTGQWFWSMIANLGLGDMSDNNFDRDYVDEVIDIFLNRKYRPNGKGGLFYIRNTDKDLRKVEIWCQLNWYLNSLLDF